MDMERFCYLYFDVFICGYVNLCYLNWNVIGFLGVGLDQI